MGINFNLMEQLVFYGSYHRKPGNQLIHFFFVPMIMWSVGVWLSYAGPVTSKIDLPSKLDFLPQELAGACEFNWAFLFILLYTVYYTILEQFAGLSWGIILGIPMIASSTYFQQHVEHAWAWALGAHLLGWFMQVEVGHILIEHRRPALLDSFFQSLVLAGLFAWMEGLFTLGYRPKLQAELKRRIDTNEEPNSKQSLLNPPPIS